MHNFKVSNLVHSQSNTVKLSYDEVEWGTKKNLYYRVIRQKEFPKGYGSQK